MPGKQHRSIRLRNGYTRSELRTRNTPSPITEYKIAKRPKCILYKVLTETNVFIKTTTSSRHN